MADRNNKLPFIYCFLDTNILHHFQTFDEVNWQKILNARQVCLVLAPVVLRELEKHKDDYNNERRRKRARTLLSKLKPLLEAETLADQPPQVRQNVFLLALFEEPVIDWETEHLDPNINDDRLLASVLDFSRQRPSEHILLIADDFPLRLKAKPRGIQTMLPDDLLRYIEPPSSEEVTIRELKQQIQELTNRMPKLKFGFYENRKIVDEIICPIDKSWQWQTPEEYVQEEIAQKRGELAQIVAKADSTVQEDEVRKFTEEYEKYLTKLELALKMQFVKNVTPYCKLELMLSNKGSAPAHGVGIHISFPKGASIVPIDELDDDVHISVTLPDDPALPEWAKPPVPDWIKRMFPYSSILSTTNLLTRNLITSSLYTPTGFSKDTYDAHSFPFGHNTLDKQISKLSHHQLFTKSIVVYIPPNTKNGFLIKYSVYADELLTPSTGELKVSWEQGT